MNKLKDFDADQFRREFSARLQLLIGDEENRKNLEEFEKKTEQPASRLSEWRNSERHHNWPSVVNLMRICIGADISPTWLLFGAGNRNLGAIKESQTMKKKIGARLMQLIEGLPLDARREAKQNLRELLDDDTPGEVQTGNKENAGTIEPRKAPARPKSH